MMVFKPVICIYSRVFIDIAPERTGYKAKPRAKVEVEYVPIRQKPAAKNANITIDRLAPLKIT
jgi:hypothetical protein